MDAQNASAIIGILCLVISYLVVRPFRVSLDELKETLKEVRVTLEQIRVDNSNMKSDIVVLNEKMKAAFKCIDTFKEDIIYLKEENAKLREEITKLKEHSN